MSFIIENMSTSFRHNKLIHGFIYSVFEESKNNLLSIYTEECALVFSGKRFDFNSVLLSPEEIDSSKRLNYLPYIQPDIFIFKNNSFLKNLEDNRIAGYPDLIVEIWSESNILVERKFKQYLYSTSPITEHWYIEQNSNIMQCFLGNLELETQSLKNILRTRNGIEFDLRYLQKGD